MKKIEEITTGWVINRLQNEQSPENFDFTCTVLSQRLLHRKRFYYNPFPDGEYHLYIYLEGLNFNGFIYKNSFNDEKLRLNKSFEFLAVVPITLAGNDVVSIGDFDASNIQTVQFLAKRILNTMGLYIHFK